MNRITCNVIADLLELYSDEVVLEDTKILVEEHLIDCAKCNEKLAQIRQNLKIPAEVNAEPIKQIKRKIKKKNIIISLVSVSIVASILLGAFAFVTQYEVAIPFKRTHIYSVEKNDDDGEIVIHFMDNIESYATRTRINYDDATMDIHIHLRDTYHIRYFSNRAKVTNSIYLPAYEGLSLENFPNHEELNVIVETDDEFPVSSGFVRVETVRVYYSTWPVRQFVPWAWWGLGEEHLIWEIDREE